ncbi:aldehyde dehydrogenase [Hesseltinella vesiculosa]|uniref:Aldehyde dehydrogenase n=1 Tax=Hesseltinella vesiculosa TaxID=101127 RepID=A0A1X2G6Y4_9FUNG|nr:aldehyde dehydrogenase [Hesseltinella vesiculosa]
MTGSNLLVDVKLSNGKTIQVQTGLFINNEFVVGDYTLDTVNPATGEVITAVQAADTPKVDEAVDAAENAYQTVWKDTLPTERQRLMLRLADLIERDAEELAQIETLDNGKPFTNSKFVDVPALLGTLRYYAGFADKLYGKLINTQVGTSLVDREPYGVCAGILPWNFPLSMLGWKLGPALVTGNVIIIKTSEITPLSALKVAALAKEAGFAPGVIQIITGYGKTAGTALSRHMRVSKLAFTGSTMVGREIMKASADTNLKKVTLELGGKSPNIIFNDADIDQAVKFAHRGIYYNQGQICCAGSRIYVQEGVYDQFVKGLQAAATTGKSGDPFDLTTMHGPLVSQMQFDRVMDYIESGKAEGAHVHTGGKRVGDKGYFIEPTIFTDVKPEMKIVKEEIFGPVAVVTKFKDEDDVVRLANDTVYGLASAVFTKDIDRALTVAKRIQAGTVWVNGYNLLENETPFGGYGQSGIGRENGEMGLDNYLQYKTIKINLNVKL